MVYTLKSIRNARRSAHAIHAIRVQRSYRPGRAEVQYVVVGDVTMAELKSKLERVLRGWQQGNVPAKNIAQVPPRMRDEVYIVDRPGAEQSLIFAGQLVPPKSNPEEIAFQTFNDAFGGAFTSRVNMNLREDKHWAYGAFSAALDARGPRLWVVGAPVQTDKTKESLQEIIKELRDATASRPLTAEELAEAKDRQTKALAGRWESGASVQFALHEIETFGLPADYYATFAQRVRAVTNDDVQRAVSRFITPGRQVWVVIGDRAKIEAGIRELGIGELKFIDADGRPKKATP